VSAAAPAEAAGAVPRATVLVVVAACCFGSISILTAVAAAGGSTLVNTMAWRYTLGSALLALVAGPRAVRAVPAGSAWRLAVLGGAGQALVSYLGLLPLTRYGVPAATLGFLFYTFPAWVALFATLRGTERVTAGRAAALALSLAGIVFLLGDPRAAALSRTGVVVALMGALVYALYIPLLGRLRGTLPAAAASVYVTAGAGAIYLAGAATTGTLTAAMSPAAWGAVATLAVVAIVVAFIVFLRGLAVLGPVRTAIVSTAEPFFTAALASVVLGEPLTARTGLGGVLIASAVVLLQRTGGGERAR
jgi:drug/metabolite transporter (DMT)-like permease